MNKSELLSIAKPILFNTSMVQAILDGRKTQTRRVIKDALLNKLQEFNAFKSFQGYRVAPKDEADFLKSDVPYHIGDILYVRETWCWCPCWDCGMDTVEGCYDETAHKFYDIKRAEWGCYGYKAGWELNSPPFDRWYPSIHMPKEAARIFLRVTDVRVEQLQDIQIKDISKEGLDNTVPSDTSDEICSYCSLPAEYQGVHCYGEEVVMCGDSPRCEEALHKWEDEYTEEFTELWNGTVKKSDLDKYGWDANPWVWVIEFERLEVSE